MSALFTLMQHHRGETVRCGQFNCVSCECGERFDGHDPHRQHIADLIEAKWELKPRVKVELDECPRCDGTGFLWDPRVDGNVISCPTCDERLAAAAVTTPNRRRPDMSRAGWNEEAVLFRFVSVAALLFAIYNAATEQWRPVIVCIVTASIFLALAIFCIIKRDAAAPPTPTEDPA